MEIDSNVLQLFDDSNQNIKTQNPPLKNKQNHHTHKKNIKKHKHIKTKKIINKENHIKNGNHKLTIINWSKGAARLHNRINHIQNIILKYSPIS